MSAVLSMSAPAGTEPRRRHAPLWLAIAMHAALVLALLNGLQPQIPDVRVPREVIVSLIAQHADSPTVPRITPEPVPRPKVEPTRLPVPPTLPMPQPLPTPATRSVMPEVPAPTSPPTPAETRSAPAQPVPATATHAPPSSPAPAPAPSHPPTAERAPATVSSVEYLQPPKPDYPISAKRAGEQGKVVLRVLVDEKGQPERVEIRESAGYPRLDEAARQAVLKAAFKPHLEDGRAVPVYVLVPVNFALR